MRGGGVPAITRAVQSLCSTTQGGGGGSRPRQVGRPSRHLIELLHRVQKRNHGRGPTSRTSGRVRMHRDLFENRPLRACPACVSAKTREHLHGRDTLGSESARLVPEQARKAAQQRTHRPHQRVAMSIAATTESRTAAPAMRHPRIAPAPTAHGDPMPVPSSRSHPTGSSRSGPTTRKREVLARSTPARSAGFSTAPEARSGVVGRGHNQAEETPGSARSSVSPSNCAHAGCDRPDGAPHGDSRCTCRSCEPHRWRVGHAITSNVLRQRHDGDR